MSMYEEYEGLIQMDGYDDCKIVICIRFGQEPIIAYDYDKVVEHLMAQGMDYDGAVEFFEYNQIGAWMGDQTPCFVILESSNKSD